MAAGDYLGGGGTTAQLGDSGIVLNTTDTFAVQWDWTSPSARGPKAAPRAEVGDRANRDGQWDATQFSGPQNRAWTVGITAPSHAALHDAEIRLRAAVTATPFKVTFSEHGHLTWQMLRQDGDMVLTYDGWGPDGPRHMTVTVGLVASDPHIYDGVDITFNLAFPLASGGLTAPFYGPFYSAATSGSNQATVVNPSSLDLPIRLRLTGPIATASIGNADSGEELILARPDGTDLLAAGEFLVVDTANHLVLFMGVTSQRDWAAGDFLSLPPQQASHLLLTGNASTGASVTGVATPAGL